MPTPPATMPTTRSRRLARYRDYVIDSLNTDKPFDQFVREQLAGDILARQAGPGGIAEPVVATGFLALSRRYATGPFELWHLTLEDAIETTGRAFLGLTLRCARCHDHKFDPVTQRDYYALYGIFASTKLPLRRLRGVPVQGVSAAEFRAAAAAGVVAARVRAHDDRLKSLEREIAELDEHAGRKEPAVKASKADPARLAALRREHERLRRAGLPPDLPGAYAVTEGKPTRTSRSSAAAIPASPDRSFRAACRGSRSWPASLTAGRCGRQRAAGSSWRTG